MAGGINPTWTEVQEAGFKRYLEVCNDFALRHLIMMIRDLLKYDQRTKEGKRAVSQARLRIATATDDELEKLANLQAQKTGSADPQALSLALTQLTQLRDTLRKKGIKKGDLYVVEGEKASG